MGFKNMLDLAMIHKTKSIRSLNCVHLRYLLKFKKKKRQVVNLP